jgi:hypothetical protein
MPWTIAMGVHFMMHDETPCLDTWPPFPWKGEYLAHLMHNNKQQSHNMLNDMNPTFFDFTNLLHMHLMSSNYCCEFPHQLINLPTSKFLCLQGKPMFQCLMVRLNGCLCVLIWMRHLLKICHHKFTSTCTTPTLDCIDHQCFYLNSRSGYFEICTTWWSKKINCWVNHIPSWK